MGNYFKYLGIATAIGITVMAILFIVFTVCYHGCL